MWHLQTNISHVYLEEALILNGEKGQKGWIFFHFLESLNSGHGFA